jgi:hypothetical protein
MRLKRSVSFPAGRTEGRVQTRTPGCQDVITFDEPSGAGEQGGIPHFGFRLVSPGDIDAAVEEVERRRWQTPNTLEPNGVG